MPYTSNDGPIDMFKIEREAQRMRSEAMAQGVRNMSKWIASHLHFGASAKPL